MSSEFSRKVGNKVVEFYVTPTAKACGSSFNVEDFSIAIDNFIKQQRKKIEDLMLNYNKLHVIMVTAPVTAVSIVEECSDFSNEKIRKIRLNINWFLSLKEL